MSHTYEEIRNAAIEILKQSDTGQYLTLKESIANLFQNREGRPAENRYGFSARGATLTNEDANKYLEVFWGLFREGIITLGMNDSNLQFPFYRVSEFGKRILQNQDPYFFHDVSTYENLVRNQIPNIDATTLIYLKEAIQAFKSGCVLSATVMIGVSTEHSFLLLLETIANSTTHAPTFKKAIGERTLLGKINAFKRILDGNMQLVPGIVQEDLETNFITALSMIRNFRNDSGHPSGNIISREQCYILLQLFIPCCKKIYQLKDVFS